MYGEKFIDYEIIGNKIVRTSEFKLFDYDYNKIIERIMEDVTDDWEELNSKHIYLDQEENIYSFDVDNVLEWVCEIIDTRKSFGDDPEEYVWLEEYIHPLEQASGFTIYNGLIPDWCKKK